jgi:hypothetical protein
MVASPGIEPGDAGKVLRVKPMKRILEGGNLDPGGISSVKKKPRADTCYACHKCRRFAPAARLSVKRLLFAVFPAARKNGVRSFPPSECEKTVLSFRRLSGCQFC